MNFGTVAILGPGLIGGSLALALAERGLAKRLMIYARSPRALDEIRLAGVDAELTQNPSEAVRDADVVILCVPIEAMAGLVHEFRDALKPTALVTDVGSVKGSVDRDLAPLLEGRALWIGSHPMAGSEQAGFSAARADLFVNAAVVVTPTKQTARSARTRGKILVSARRPRAEATTPSGTTSPSRKSATSLIWWPPSSSPMSPTNRCPPPVPACAIPRASLPARRSCGRKLSGPTARPSAPPCSLCSSNFKVHEALAGEDKSRLRDTLQYAHDQRSKLRKPNLT
jgi:predicted dinucleotide-binding enzyme